jgi:GNAT superfamily N-acetyltransferase
VDGDLRVRNGGARAESLSVRLASTADLDAIVALNHAAATAAYAPIFGDAPYPEDGVRRRYARLLADPEVRVFIADGAGYAAARPGHVEALYVVPEAWGSGAADTLYGHAAEIAGVPATLWVLEENVRARRFWERRGWRPTGERDESGKTELRYRLTDEFAAGASSND